MFTRMGSPCSSSSATNTRPLVSAMFSSCASSKGSWAATTRSSEFIMTISDPTGEPRHLEHHVVHRAERDRLRAERLTKAAGRLVGHDELDSLLRSVADQRERCSGCLLVLARDVERRGRAGLVGVLAALGFDAVDQFGEFLVTQLVAHVVLLPV